MYIPSCITITCIELYRVNLQGLLENMVAINQVCAAVLVLIVVFLARGTAHVTEAEMYEELEKALVANSTNLYNLQNTFYPPTPPQPDKVTIFVHVMYHVTEDNCHYCDWKSTQSKCICSLPYFWTTSATTNQQYNLKRIIHDLYPSFNVMEFNVFQFVTLITGDSYHGDTYRGSTVPSTNVTTTIILWLELNTTSDMYRDYSDACWSLLVWVSQKTVHQAS